MACGEKHQRPHDHQCPRRPPTRRSPVEGGAKQIEAEAGNGGEEVVARRRHQPPGRRQEPRRRRPGHPTRPGEATTGAAPKRISSKATVTSAANRRWGGGRRDQPGGEARRGAARRENASTAPPATAIVWVSQPRRAARAARLRFRSRSMRPPPESPGPTAPRDLTRPEQAPGCRRGQERPRRQEDQAWRPDSIQRLRTLEARCIRPMLWLHAGCPHLPGAGHHGLDRELLDR